MIWTLFALQLALGACLGSACTTAALRSVRRESFVFGRSHCDGCGEALGFGATVPIVSYVFARGACTRCDSRIDPLHLLGEIAGAIVVLTAFQVADAPRAVVLCGIGFCLLTTAVIDARTQRLPDPFTAAIALMAAALALLTGPERLAIDGAAAGVTFAFLQVIRWISTRRMGEPGLGFGDVKLASALALWNGAAISWTLAIASLLGLLAFRIQKSQRRLPFGPWIALAGWVVGIVIERWGGIVERWTW